MTVPFVDCSEKLPPVQDHSEVKRDCERIGARLHVIETVPAGLLKVESLIVKPVLLWLTVPPLLL